MRVGLASRSLNDDPHCGDVCGYWQRGRTITLCVADGLGHGLHAERAAQAAVSYVGRHLTARPPWRTFLPAVTGRYAARVAWRWVSP